MCAGKKSMRLGRWALALCIALFAIWYWAPPKVYIFYSPEGTKLINYVLNTQHHIVKGDLLPGQVTGDITPAFPDKDFFMEFYWWRDQERRHCVSIMPGWPRTHVYLGADGSIDMSKEGGTHTTRLKKCLWDTVKP